MMQEFTGLVYGQCTCPLPWSLINLQGRHYTPGKLGALCSLLFPWSKHTLTALPEPFLLGLRSIELEGGSQDLLLCSATERALFPTEEGCIQDRNLKTINCIPTSKATKGSPPLHSPGITIAVRDGVQSVIPHSVLVSQAIDLSFTLVMFSTAHIWALENPCNKRSQDQTKRARNGPKALQPTRTLDMVLRSIGMGRSGCGNETLSLGMK